MSHSEQCPSCADCKTESDWLIMVEIPGTDRQESLCEDCYEWREKENDYHLEMDY